VRERGVGFCALNGLALVAHVHRDLRVFVIDCDEHGGNGTEEFAAELPNLYTASIFGTRFGCRGGARSWAFQVVDSKDSWRKYRRALREVQQLLRVHRPELLIYQAGADCHEDDPKSRARMNERAMYDRDLIVFIMAAKLKIPTVFLVAGGYQSPDVVARLNENSVRAARVVFGHSSDAGPARVSRQSAPQPPRPSIPEYCQT
jgi:acetoin utilization deacetylase AcuC-like enzyme